MTGWMPPAGELPGPVATGVRWDAVRVRDWAVVTATLDRLGRDTGAVIADGRTGAAYWMVPPHAADTWPAMPDVTVLGPGDFVAVPPLRLTRGPGPHWLAPFFADAYLTDPDRLRDALQAATAPAREAEAASVLPGLTPEERARRDQVLSARLREVNHRSTTGEVRPW
ncbi:hypothetical protein [Wenjunlia vitaminophila]|uniref:hypothetical protein n=1 Tax=Wenjunlia vitaminophila TaxID=76728 RepID=UPI000A5AD3AF|nr:hypothetical protein [Wenjunlia vitaminophila]